MYQFIYLSIDLYTHWSIVIHQSVDLSIYRSIDLSIDLSIYLSSYLSIYRGGTHWRRGSRVLKTPSSTQKGRQKKQRNARPKVGKRSANIPTHFALIAGSREGIIWNTFYCRCGPEMIENPDGGTEGPDKFARRALATQESSRAHSFARTQRKRNRNRNRFPGWGCPHGLKPLNLQPMRFLPSRHCRGDFFQDW